MSIMDKIRKSVLNKEASTINESKYLEPEFIDTGIPALNIILSGKPNGGFESGFTMVGGYKASYKTTLCLKMIDGFLKKYPEGAVIYYDSEKGASKQHFESLGIDMNRIMHVPVDSVSDLTHEMVAVLTKLEMNDKVMFFIDSLGMLGSNKEFDDAVNKKSAADFTRAKELGSFIRIITPRLNKLKLPCVAINHIYKDISSLYGGDQNSGGEKLQYSANTIIHIRKSKDKESNEVTGHKFTLVVNKSRHIVEGTQIPLIVKYNSGINKYSGMLDLAIDLGWIIRTGAFYMAVDKNTGEELFSAKKYRKDFEDDHEFWENLFSLGFADEIYEKVKLKANGSDELTFIFEEDEEDENDT